MKPSDAIAKRAMALVEARLFAIKLKSNLSPSELSPCARAAIDHDANDLAFAEWVDTETERRTTYEQDITERLWALEQAAGETSERLAKVERHAGAQPFAGWYDRGGVLEKEASPEAQAHVAHRDSLSRHGTGHPSELPCAKCGRPSWDLQTAITANGKRYCSAACNDADARSPLYVGDGMPSVRLREATDYVGPGEPKIRTYEPDGSEPEQ